MADSLVVTEFTTHSREKFDAKINSWAEGTLLTIDADSSKLTIRGTIRPYATEYAKMLKRIHDKTEHMTQMDRVMKALDIRISWKAALQEAKEKDALVDSDFTFHLPGVAGKLVVVDETAYYNRENKELEPVCDTGSLTDKEIKAIQALKDLKVGECVVVGYESGLLINDAYVVIKANPHRSNSN
jgi:hypothetical protein